MKKTTGKKKGKKMIKVIGIAVIAVLLLMFIGINIVMRAYSGSRAEMPQ